MKASEITILLDVYGYANNQTAIKGCAYAMLHPFKTENTAWLADQVIERIHRPLGFHLIVL
jgi:hypothetical protein